MNAFSFLNHTFLFCIQQPMRKWLYRVSHNGYVSCASTNESAAQASCLCCYYSFTIKTTQHNTKLTFFFFHSQPSNGEKCNSKETSVQYEHRFPSKTSVNCSAVNYNRLHFDINLMCLFAFSIVNVITNKASIIFHQME